MNFIFSWVGVQTISKGSKPFQICKNVNLLSIVQEYARF